MNANLMNHNTIGDMTYQIIMCPMVLILQFLMMGQVHGAMYMAKKIKKNRNNTFFHNGQFISLADSMMKISSDLVFVLLSYLLLNKRNNMD